MNILLSELQDKQIISIVTGLNYGRVIDVEIDSSGNIVKFIVDDRKIFRKASASDITFRYNDIEKIGEDVILVRV